MIKNFCLFDLKTKIIVVSLLFVVLLGVILFCKEQVFSVLERLSGLSKIFDDGGILTILTSGRTNFVIDSYNNLKNSEYYLFQLFFGNGFSSLKLTEMDFFDIFFSLGITGLSFVVLFIVNIASKLVKHLNKTENYVLLCGYLLILAYASITGHVLFMATSGTYFAIYCNLILIQTYLKKKNKEI